MISSINRTVWGKKLNSIDFFFTTNSRLFSLFLVLNWNSSEKNTKIVRVFFLTRVKSIANAGPWISVHRWHRRIIKEIGWERSCQGYQSIHVMCSELIINREKFGSVSVHTYRINFWLCDADQRGLHDPILCLYNKEYERYRRKNDPWPFIISLCTLHSTVLKYPTRFFD